MRKQKPAIRIPCFLCGKVVKTTYGFISQQSGLHIDFYCKKCYNWKLATKQ